MAGLTAIVKQQAEAQKATNTQIANLAEALLPHGGPPAAPATAQVNSPSLRMPALQLPQFRYDQNTHDDVNEFLESFDVQTTHLQAATKLTLLQQACIGEWPNSVLSMEKAKFTDETTPLQKLDSFKQALKSAFAEPLEVQLRRLASEFSAMKQRVTESIDRFAFRFKNNLHRLAKLGEPVDRNSPQFIMSQFISKTKPDIQKHLVLKAEEYKDLSEIVEAAKRIERSFSPSHTQPNKRSPEQTLLPRIQLLVVLVVAAKDPAVLATIPMAIPKATAPKKRRKTTILRIPNEVTKFAVYGTNINDLPCLTRPILQISPSSQLQHLFQAGLQGYESCKHSSTCCKLLRSSTTTGNPDGTTHFSTTIPWCSVSVF